MLSVENLRDKLSGKSLESCVKILERSLVKLKPKNVCKYLGYPTAVITADLPTSTKKSLLLALSNVGISFKYKIWHYLGYGASPPLCEVLKIRDIALLIFMRIKLGMGLNTPEYVRKIVRDIAKSNVERDNEFIIQLLTVRGINLPGSFIKIFLYGAIEGRNMTIIKFIVEGLRFFLFIPTHQVSRYGVLAPAFIENDDVELVKWFAARGYNIHECQRYLRELAYTNGKPLLQEYITDEQSKMESADLYMKKLSNLAIEKGDIVFLTKYPKLSCSVTFGTLVDALIRGEQPVVLRSLFDRYVELNITCRFERFHVTRLYNSCKNHPNLWEIAKKYLYDYGTPGARDHIISLSPL